MDRRHPRLPPLLHIPPPPPTLFTEILIAKTSASDNLSKLADTDQKRLERMQFSRHKMSQDVVMGPPKNRRIIKLNYRNTPEN